MLPKGFRFALAWLLAWMGAPPGASADVFYQYTGPNFTSVAAGSPYTTSDFITAQFQLPNALGGNLSNQTVCNSNCTIPFSISDGVETFTNANSSLGNFNQIETNGAGIPTNWTFVVFGNVPIDISSGGSIGGDAVTSLACTSQCAVVAYTPSAQFWTIVPVPEPSTLTLSAIGLSVLGVVT